MGAKIVSKNDPTKEHIDSENMTIDMIPMRALRVAVAVADRGSFAAAGRHLNLPRAAISRIVGQLEEKTERRLFRRNTRKVVPTGAGDDLIEAARRALAEMDAALQPVEKSDARLSGQVRMSVSHAFGRHFILPSIGRFRARHADVHVETLLEDRLDDMVEESIDFTVRLGPLPESDLIIRRVGTIRSALFAAPSFLRDFEHPLERDTLGSVPAVGFRVPGTGNIMSWPMSIDGSVTQSIAPRSVVSSGSIEAVADLARDGQGVALLPRYMTEADIADRRLEPVLPDLVSLQTAVHICFREKRFMPRQVRALIDHLASEITETLELRS